MLRILAITLLASLCVVSARYLESTRDGEWRGFVDDQLLQIFVPRRGVRHELVDYTPTPCRWKLCASLYR